MNIKTRINAGQVDGEQTTILELSGKITIGSGDVKIRAS